MNWEDLMVEAEENLLEKGYIQGELTCRKLGLKLLKVESVDIVESHKVNKPAPEKQEEGEDGE